MPGGRSKHFQTSTKNFVVNKPLRENISRRVSIHRKGPLSLLALHTGSKKVKKFPNFFGDSPSIAMATMAYRTGVHGIGNNGAPTW
jgi:hypothetical protein